MDEITPPLHDNRRPAPAPASAPSVEIRPAMVTLFAVACGAVVANLYYAQPLTALIGPDVGLAPDATGLVVTLAQIGYAAGLLLLVPLGDLVENRRLILLTFATTVVALVAMSLARSGPLLLLASLLVGVTAVVAQMLIPLAAHLAPEARRGQVVGNIMAGLLTGILLARPAASLITDLAGWRMVFAISAGLMVIVAAILAFTLPARKPPQQANYGGLLLSMTRLVAEIPLLRRRMIYQSCLFGSFSLFWTAVPFALAAPPFGYGQRGIALFALAGLAGALIAPVAGRVADRGWIKTATGVALAGAALSFAVAALGHLQVVMLGLAAILLDAGVQMNMVVSQREIYALHAGLRSRLNGVYMASFFFAGALGSALASPVFLRVGWIGICGVGALFCLLGLAVFATELGRRTLPQ